MKLILVSILITLTACGGDPFENGKLGRLGVNDLDSATTIETGNREETGDDASTASDSREESKETGTESGYANDGNTTDSAIDAGSQDAGGDVIKQPANCCQITQLNGNNVGCYAGNKVMCVTAADCSMGTTCLAWPNSNESQCPGECCAGVVVTCQ